MQHDEALSLGQQLESLVDAGSKRMLRSPACSTAAVLLVTGPRGVSAQLHGRREQIFAQQVSEHRCDLRYYPVAR